MTNCKFYKVSDKNDIEVVRLLAERIWHEHYNNILDEKQINYMLSTVHSEQAIRDFISIRRSRIIRSAGLTVK